MSFGQGGPPWGSDGSGQQPGQGSQQQGYGYPQQQGQQQDQGQGGYGHPQQGQGGGYGYPQQQGQGGYGYPRQQDQGGGYGYPQQQSPYGQQQGGQYGVPAQQQPAAQQGQAQPSGPTPDWGALAEASASRTRKRRLLMIGGAALATVLIGTAVAIAVVTAGGSGSEASDDPTGKLPTTADIPSNSHTPGPSFAATTPPPPPDPEDYISSAKKDTAPLGAGTLFPGPQATVGDHTYKKGPTNDTRNCKAATKASLAAVLSKNHCTRLIRAAYTKSGASITVGVALFDTAAEATRAKDQADRANLVSLTGHGVGTYCRTGICRGTINARGRYVYITIAGFTNGKNVTKKDHGVYAMGDDLRQFTFDQINRRGEAQASAAAQEPQ